MRPRKIYLAAGALVLAVAVVFVFRYRSAPKFPALEDLNVVLIIVDTLGVEHLGSYQPELKHTPNIDKLAAQGVRFSKAFATSSWTKPTIASVHTGLMPSRHKVQTPWSALDSKFVTLAELFKAKGYKTAGIYSHILLKPKYGFKQGFDDYKMVSYKRDIHAAISSDQVTDHALAWLKQNGEREDSRFFLFLHYFDPHYFYNHHAEFDQTSGYRGTLTAGMDIHALLKQRFSYDAADLRYLVGLYREEIAYTDYHLGRFFDYLQKTGFNKNTLIVFVADHGEEFMRHGFIGHVRTLYDELIHVPLIVSLPGKLSPKVVTTPVSQIDIVPTLMALWKEPPPALPFDGQNLVPWLMAEQAKPALREIFTEVDSHSKSKEKAAFKSAIISGKWKLIHDKPTDSWELFNRETDPEELKNIIEQEAVLAKVLQEKLGLFEKNQASGSKETEIDINPEEVEQLKSLGYM